MAAIDELTQAMTTLKQKGDECSTAWSNLQAAQTAFNNAQTAAKAAQVTVDEEIAAIESAAALPTPKAEVTA